MNWLCKSFPIKSKIICIIIMDQIGLLGSWIFVGNLALVVLAFPSFCFPFSFNWCRTRERTQRFGFVTKEGDHFTPPQVLTKLLLLFSFIFPFQKLCTLFKHCLVQGACSSFFFALLLSLIDWFLFFSFLFFLLFLYLCFLSLVFLFLFFSFLFFFSLLTDTSNSR